VNLKKYTGYFTSDNEPDGIENATHNTLERKPGHGSDKYSVFPPDVLWVAFSAYYHKHSQHTRYFICQI
jgi:hypothetical protein